jgi:hypothetical protein
MQGEVDLLQGLLCDERAAQGRQMRAAPTWSAALRDTAASWSVPFLSAS